MAEPRLASHIWIAAWRARLEAAGIPVYVRHRGDPTAGSVLVKLATLDGRAVLKGRSVDLMTGERTWMVLAEGPEADVEDSLARQRRYDPDLWVVEVEDRQGRDFLDAEGLD